MADIWEEIIYPASFGGVPIDVLSTRDTFRRAIVQFGPPGRDGSILQDMGAEARVVNAQIFFFEREGDAATPTDQRDHVRRARDFITLANRLEAQEFVHPLFGSFPAKVESMDVSAIAEDRDQIVVDAILVEEGINPKPLTSQIADPNDGADASVAAQAEIARQEAAAGVTAETLTEDEGELVVSVADDCETTVDSWSTDPDITPRDVTAALQRMSSRISSALGELELAGDVDN
jgi:prophage DNA circulation protein